MANKTVSSMQDCGLGRGGEMGNNQNDGASRAVSSVRKILNSDGAVTLGKKRKNIFLVYRWVPLNSKWTNNRVAFFE